MARVIDAIDFAAHAHRAQRRKDAEGTPYINHPIALVRILGIEAGIDDPDVLCAAALHDYLEDCCGGDDQPTVEQGEAIVRQRFGDSVLDYVMAVSDDKALPKAERKRLQVEHAANAPYGARLVKLADKIANLRDIASSPPAGWSPQRRREYFDWAGSVVMQLRGTHHRLDGMADSALAGKP
jgi:guanosine-3',5'-bis(diphosphate) 3'-pyrophosphohydrolase